MPFTIYPAIDLKSGRCVRLTQGRSDQETVYSTDPAGIAKSFADAGSTWIHCIDLDGAFTGTPQNRPAVESIIRASGLRVQLGGGLRTRQSLDAAIASGAARTVIGTSALENESFLREVVCAHREKIAVGIDAKDGFVTVKGWVEKTKTRATTLATRAGEIGVDTIIYTDIATDGMLTGPNFAALQEVLTSTPIRVIASGGVGSLAHVEQLVALAKKHPNLDGVIIGKALYEEKFTLKDALAAAKA